MWPSTSLVTGVNATWTVPTLNCSVTPNGLVGIWVGIGGVGGSSGALLQTGISSECVNGLQENAGWWELVPASPNQAVDFTGFPVSAGDVVTVSVYQGASGSWETRLDDTTTGLMAVMASGESWGVGSDSGNTYAVQGDASGISYAGGYTAEWIVENPEVVNGGQIPFADFGSVTFSNMGMAPGPWSGGITDPQNDVELVQGSQVLAVPSWPGTGMTVTYTG